MENAKIAIQMVRFQKTLFENSFDTVCAIQDQTEEMTNNVLDQMAWIPEEGVKAFQDSVDIYKKARDSYKKAVEEGFDKLEEIVQNGKN
jgi:hypothetical protein